jgi:hypothetical protein
MNPACRFACQNYFKGGWHPIGRIAIGVKASEAGLDKKQFDDLATDITIGYGRIS